MNSDNRNAHNGNAPASPSPESGEPRARVASGTVQPRHATPVSANKIDANRRNARESTGPKTEAGKAVSRLNALKHGLLAKEVVITRGDYQEDEQEFAQLLAELGEQFKPVGVAEELEVQKIALCYWRTMRAVQYEHGRIRLQTGNMRGRAERRREESVDRALRYDFPLEGTSSGIQYLIDQLEDAKEQLRNGKISGEALAWLVKQFPDNFALPQPSDQADPSEDGRKKVKPEYLRGLRDGIAKQLRRLFPLRDEVAQVEELDLVSKLKAATLPTSQAIEKLLRYETGNNRELDRALARLEQMQDRCQLKGVPHPEK
jgi:hypothetical protein